MNSLRIKIISIILFTFVNISFICEAQTPLVIKPQIIATGRNAPYITYTNSSNGQSTAKINFYPGNGYSKYQKVLFFIYFDSIDGWTVNIGDSISNNGYAGDAINQSYDAELQIVGGKLTVYCSDYGNSEKLFEMAEFVRPGDTIGITISNGRIELCNFVTKVTKEIDNPYIFALNGQVDNEGAVNYDIYAAFNRVILYEPDRIKKGTGKGACNVEIYFL